MTGFEFLLAVNVYYEAADTDRFMCRVQIAQVVMERSKKKKMSIKNVIFKRKWFSWTNKGVLDNEGNLKKEYHPPNDDRWRESVAAAKLVYRGKVLNYAPGTDHYYADYINPPWWWYDIEPASVFKCGIHYFGKRKEL